MERFADPLFSLEKRTYRRQNNGLPVGGLKRGPRRLKNRRGNKRQKWLSFDKGKKGGQIRKAIDDTEIDDRNNDFLSVRNSQLFSF